MKKLVLSCFFIIAFGAVEAQHIEGSFRIIGDVEGKIFDKKTNKNLDRQGIVNTKTEFQFSNISNQAKLQNLETESIYKIKIPDLERNRAEIAFNSNQVFTLSSEQAMSQFRVAPARKSMRDHRSLPLDTALFEYFGSGGNALGTDTFTNIGNKLNLQHLYTDKYILVFRCVKDNNDYFFQNFVVSKEDLPSNRNRFKIMLKDGDNFKEITEISLFFIEEKQLIIEFEDLLIDFIDKIKITCWNRRTKYC